MKLDFLFTLNNIAFDGELHINIKQKTFKVEKYKKFS